MEVKTTLRLQDIINYLQCETFNCYQEKIDFLFTDSRDAIVNGMFIAIRGEKHDGHRFINNIYSNYPSCVFLVDENFTPEKNMSCIIVKDTILALGHIAMCHRMEFNIPVVAITGSNGKTTVKEMLATVCKKELLTLSTVGNRNNHIGLPLTLLQLTDSHQVAILELGMDHSGEISYLSKIVRPTIAIVNNISSAHICNFNSLNEIAAAKCEIFDGLNGIACINSNNDFADMMQKTTQKQCIYGIKHSFCYIEYINNFAIVHTDKEKLELKLQVIGKHNYENALSTIVLALNLGINLKTIINGLQEYKGYSHRLEKKTSFTGSVIIDDTYNANTQSVIAAINAMQNLPRPHWILFGDMLGNNELDHKYIGEVLNGYKFDMLLTVGEMTKETFNCFLGKKYHFVNNVEAKNFIFNHLPSICTMLAKGSNAMKIGQIVDEIVVN